MACQPECTLFFHWQVASPVALTAIDEELLQTKPKQTRKSAKTTALGN